MQSQLFIVDPGNVPTRLVLHSGGTEEDTRLLRAIYGVLEHGGRVSLERFGHPAVNITFNPATPVAGQGQPFVDGDYED